MAMIVKHPRLVAPAGGVKFNLAAGLLGLGPATQHCPELLGLGPAV